MRIVFGALLIVIVFACNFENKKCDTSIQKRIELSADSDPILRSYFFLALVEHNLRLKKKYDAADKILTKIQNEALPYVRNDWAHSIIISDIALFKIQIGRQDEVIAILKNARSQVLEFYTICRILNNYIIENMNTGELQHKHIILRDKLILLAYNLFMTDSNLVFLSSGVGCQTVFEMLWRNFDAQQSRELNSVKEKLKKIIDSYSSVNLMVICSLLQLSEDKASLQRAQVYDDMETCDLYDDPKSILMEGIKYYFENKQSYTSEWLKTAMMSIEFSSEKSKQKSTNKPRCLLQYYMDAYSEGILPKLTEIYDSDLVVSNEFNSATSLTKALNVAMSAKNYRQQGFLLARIYWNLEQNCGYRKLGSVKK